MTLLRRAGLRCARQEGGSQRTPSGKDDHHIHQREQRHEPEIQGEYPLLGRARTCYEAS